VRIDLTGLRTGPSQTWGALRLVPLLRDRPVDGLRLHRIAYSEEPRWSEVKLTSKVSYYSYIPHGFVADWNRDSGDGSQSAAYGTQLLDQRGSVLGMPMPVHRRMTQKLGKQRARFLPLHFAIEGYLTLHFGGPDIAWREWSDRVLRNGLSPRAEAAYRGTAITGLQDALKVFEIHEGQCGVLLYAADALAAAFAVPHPEDYRELHPTLVLDLFGDMVYQYALMTLAVQEFRVDIADDGIDSLSQLRAAAEAQSAMWAEFNDRMMANALLDRDYTAERGYQMGEFDLVRFRPRFKPGEENHIGEAITDRAGAIAYLKTFRLSEAQIRRGYLLELLASHDWRLSAAAETIGTTAEDLRGRLRAAGFEMMLRQKEKR
jgi:ARPP-2